MNKTLTPLFDAIEALRRQDFSRFHTPGHKGSALGFLSAVTPWDFTEVRGADSLFEADGPISETERLYTGFCGTAGSFLSAGGSTLCIQAMLRLVQPLGQKILIGRNAHGSAVSAMALLGLTPVWLCPETGTDLLPAPITPAQAEAALARHPDAAAVYVTSPDYFGKLTDIAGLSEVCRRYGVPLLVDNAHGAELFFTDGARHPMQLGADLCCDSLHKTLPVLTGGAMLHVGDTALARKSGFAASAKEAMHLFGSTSPSYLVMLSMDTLLPSLYDGTLRREVGETAARVAALRSLAAGCGFLLPEGETLPTRLTLIFSALGCTRQEFDAACTAAGVEPEYLADHACVFLCSARNREEDFRRLETLIRTLPRRAALQVETGFHLPEPVCPPREAILSPHRTLPLAEAEGRVAAGVISRCPPGIPLVMPGERLDKNILADLNKYGILQVDVLE